MRKTAYFLLLTAILSLSCSKEKESESVSSPADAQIYSIRLTGDTLESKSLATAIFSIDQINNRIQNKDSLPFGTVITMVKCAITTKSASGTIFYPDAENMSDSIIWNGVDSLDMSKKSRLKIIAKNGINSRTYDIWTNIYSIKADSFVWTQLNSRVAYAEVEQQRTVLMPDSFMHSYVKTAAGFELYTSYIGNDAVWKKGAVWTKQDLSNFPANANLDLMPYCASKLYVADAEGALYQSADGIAWEKAKGKGGTDGLNHPVKALLGSLGDEIEAIIGTSGNYLLATYSPADSLIYEGDALFDDFPLEGFASVGYKRDYRDRLLLVAGNNSSGIGMETSWMKTQGQNWIKITQGYKRISPRSGAVCIPYDKQLLLIGGLDNDGYKKDIYYSPDFGLSWIPANDSLQVMPENFKARAGASVLSDNKNNVYIIGGEEKVGTVRNVLNDIWRGRIHRLSK